jgi:DNA-binding NtrC family response regulator
MSPKLHFEVVSLAEVAQEDTVVLPKESGPLVLIVDDEKVIADTLSIILSRAGFTTMTAYNAETALEIATATPPALLISDVVMPGASGVDLAITITQTLPECKVLLFSGQAATVDLLEKARRDGYYFTTLSKPVHPTDMLKRISECLAFSKPVSDARIASLPLASPVAN